ncbi:CATRA conflict system CASPASE/TPR repeat-associated protein [Streptomyces sp. PTD5-9]|uniref:CATRA conflict system CASPASE/TPR repeat-associated protein n=1 Tax=Streptomyces sp. PTD5-9 TaxID=3120150 RepID=UPI00300B28C1
MPRSRFEGHALIVHVFVPLAAAVRDEENGDRSVRRFWDGLRGGLGAAGPVPRFGPAGLPALAPAAAAGPATGHALLAACQSTGPAPAQVFAYRRGDALGVLAVLFPAPGVSWRDLRDRWDAVARPLPEGLGAVTTYVHRVLDGGRTRPGAGPLNRLLASAPAAGASASPGGGWRRSPDGYLVAFPHSVGPGRVRTAVVVGPAAREDAFDAWGWHIAPTGAVAPFVRCLEGGARLRHHASVHRAHQPALRAMCARLSAASERLAGLCGAVLAAGSGPDELLAADASIAALYVGDQGLNQSLRDLRDMRRSVRITLDSLAELLPPPADGPDPDPALGRSLLALLDDDIAHAESVKREADEISRTTESIVRQRLALLQQRTTVVQGAVLGSLLTALAAVQTLSYELPLPGPLHAPLITFLSVLALLLPVQLMRWRRADGRVRRPAWFDRLSVACVGAATGWLGASVAASVTAHVPARPAVSGGCAAACAVAAVLADRWWASRAA